MATPTIIGVGGAGNLPVTNELKIDLWKKRQTSFGAITPLTKITSRLAVNPAHNFQIEAIEENEIPTIIFVGETEASVGTTVVMQANATMLVPDTLLYNPKTNDYRSVDSLPTTQSVTVTISQGGITSSSVWEAGDQLEVLPPQLAENDETMRAISAQSTRVYNYEQLAKLQYALTRTNNDMATNFGGPGEFRRMLKRQKYRQFREQSEKLRMLGGRASSGTAPATKRSAGGLNHFLRDGTLFKDFNGTFTESGFDNWLGDYSDQNPDMAYVDFLCAPNILRQINYFAKDKIRISPQSKAYGLNLKRYIGGPIEVNLIRAPLLKGAQLSGWGWLLDFTRIKLQDVARPKFYPDAKTVGESEIIYDTYREQTSMIVCNEDRHGMCIGASLAA